MRLSRAKAEFCGEALDLAVFYPEGRAVEHIRKHVFDPSERWETLIPSEVIAAAKSLEPLALQRAYDGYAAEIAEGVRFGASFPCHLHTEHRGPADPAWRPHFGFLSRRGVRIFADRSRVRTAYRTALRRGGHSDYAYFARAWFDFMTRSCALSGSAGLAEPGEERVRRACLGRAGLAPPNIVQWRALAPAGARGTKEGRA